MSDENIPPERFIAMAEEVYGIQWRYPDYVSAIHEKDEFKSGFYHGVLAVLVKTSSKRLEK